MRFKTLLLVSIPLGRNPMWSVFKKSHFTRFYNCGGVRFWSNSHVRTDEMRLRKGLNTHRSRNTGTGRFESGIDLHGMDRSWPGKNYLNHMDRSWVCWNSLEFWIPAFSERTSSPEMKRFVSWNENPDRQSHFHVNGKKQPEELTLPAGLICQNRGRAKK